MKFVAKGTELNNILRKVVKGYNNKEDNSYIAFELDVEENKLIITSRSRATFFKGELKVTSIEFEAGEPMVYHLDGMKLKQLVSILPNAPVDINFSIDDSTRSFTIKTSASKYKLPVLSETPLAPAPEVEEYVTIDANDFMKVAKDLIKILSTDPSTQEHQVSCMHIKLKNDKTTMIATDAYALGSITIDSSKINLTEEKDILIRHTEVATLLDNFADGEMLTVVGSDEMFGYIDESGTLSLVGQINMTPLNIEQVESVARADNTILVDKGELRSAIETTNKLSPNDDTVDINIAKDGSLVRISNRYGDYIDIVPSETKLETPGKATFSTNVLLKSIMPANDGSIRLEFGDLSENTPGAVKIVSLQSDGTDDEDTSLLATKMIG